MSTTAQPEDDIEARVRDYIALMADVKLDRVQPTTRLLDDLGIDGDDAGAFFAGLHERFGTDLSQLYERWDEHFGPEGVSWSSALIIVPGVFVGSLVANDVGWIAGVAVAVSLVAASVWIVPRLGLASRFKPITVAEVIQAVKAGAWP